MNISQHTSQSRQQGFALVAALFLIVVLAGLGLFAVRLSSSQQQSINLTLLSSRALAAANSGIEFGANQALKANLCNKITLICNNVTLNLNQAALNGFTVLVTAQISSHTIWPAVLPNYVYELTATATYGTYGKPDYVSRKVLKTVTDIP